MEVFLVSHRKPAPSFTFMKGSSLPIKPCLISRKEVHTQQNRILFHERKFTPNKLYLISWKEVHFQQNCILFHKRKYTPNKTENKTVSLFKKVLHLNKPYPFHKGISPNKTHLYKKKQYTNNNAVAFPPCIKCSFLMHTASWNMDTYTRLWTFLLLSIYRIQGNSDLKTNVQKTERKQSYNHARITTRKEVQHERYRIWRR